MLDCSIDYDGIERLGIAVSGGMDSMALLDCVIKRLDKQKIIVINIEHGIRGSSSKSDSEFVERECERLEIECIRIAIDTPKYAREKSISIEQAARELRYSEFDKLLRVGKVNKICLAHHKSDQVETILMRILRGTGINGLRGIPRERDGYLRPFMDISRNEIEKYIEKNNIDYIQDESNSDIIYTRNYIRNIILPNIKELYPDYENAIIRLSINASEDYEFIKAKALKPIMDKGAVFIPIDYLREQKSIVRETIIESFSMLGVKTDIERVHIEKIISMYDCNNGDSLNMPHNVVVYREYDKIAFQKTQRYDTRIIPFNKGEYQLGKYVLNIEQYQGKGLLFDYDKVPQDAIIRFRIKGDRFKKFKGGSKSLGDYMTDVKMPNRIRATYPIIASGKTVLIVPEYEISDMIKVDNYTKNKFTIKCRSIYD